LSESFFINEKIGQIKSERAKRRGRRLKRGNKSRGIRKGKKDYAAQSEAV
jgi:hypothetical protein